VTTVSTHPPTRTALLLLTLLLVAAPRALAAPEAETTLPAPIRFQGGEYRPAPGLELGGRPGERIHRLLQFAELPGEDTRRALAAAGIELLEYLPERTYLAALPGGLAPEHPALADAVFAGPQRPEDKITARLAETLARGTAPDGSLEVAVRPQRDLAREELLGELAGAGFEGRRDGRGQLLVRLEPSSLRSLAAQDGVSLLDAPWPRLVLLNDGARSTAEVEPLHAPPYELYGSGVRVGIWDGTGVDTGHPDFGGRAVVAPGEYTPASCSGHTGCRHATHVAGTIAGDGLRSASEGGTAEQWRGMAPEARIYSYEFIDESDLWAEVVDAIDRYDIHQTQNSWGYCIDDGDPSCAPCSTYGDYEGLAEIEDRLVRGEGGKRLSVVFSAGNSRNDVTSCPLNGSPYLNYGTLTPPGTAKNTLTVGAINGNDLSATTFSSWGPTDDGRIKPDLVAPGCENPRSDSSPGGSIWSLAGGGEGYSGWCGTSMAAPVVSGGVALLREELEAQGLAVYPSLVRALLIHTAEDQRGSLGARAGPDYATGWGLIQVRSAVQRARGGGRTTLSLTPQNPSRTDYFLLDGSEPELRVTVAWDDYAASPGAATTLVSDLDLVVTSPSGVRHYPWTLDPADPTAAARRDREDHVNNVEQVLVEDPEAGEWSIQVRAASLPSGAQTYSIVLDPDPEIGPFTLVSPVDDELVYADTPPLAFVWSPGSQTRFKVEWSRSASFSSPKKSSGKPWLREVESFTPDASLWKRILKLGKSTGSIYWRVKAKNAEGDRTTSETRRMELYGPEPALVYSPAEGEVFDRDEPPPTLSWEPNHNKKYQVIFATRANLGGKRTVKSGKGYTLIGSSWTIPQGKWDKIRNRLAPKNPDGTVYYVLFSKDHVGRRTQSPVRTLRVVDGG
jgi:subtilisin family serine protease